MQNLFRSNIVINISNEFITIHLIYLLLLYVQTVEHGSYKFRKSMKVYLEKSFNILGALPHSMFPFT